MIKITNESALELFNLLNTLDSPAGSHQELAVARTLRNMKKEWLVKYNEKVQDINDDNSAVEERNGSQILLKHTLKRVTKNKKGEDETEEYQIPVYTKDGEKKRKEQLRKLNEAQACGNFDIFTTSDDSGLSTYQKEALGELGFLLSPKEQNDKISSIKGEKLKKVD